MSDVQRAEAKPCAPFKRPIDEVQEGLARIAATQKASAERDRNGTKHLAPDRHRQQDFFIAALLDPDLKDDLWNCSKTPANGLG